MSVDVFGIRHHGPGSSRSVLAALEAAAPDLVLIEGPPEASALIPIAADPDLVPPVAILAYDPGEPSRAGFYPFASFSPEWQAMQFALRRGIAVRFIDLPLVHALLVDRRAEALERLLGAQPEGGKADDPDEGRPGEAGAAEAEAAEAPDSVLELREPEIDIRLDPLGYMGKVAGEDGERWWERLVEERRDPTETFEAITLLMTELRQAVETLPSDLRREAAMRIAIREAQAAGSERIAVVCGAWHAPALVDAGDPKADAKLLKGLPKTKVETTWVPWSEAHLASASGYGAGIESPGWYSHLWTTPANLTETWMAKTARVLRSEGLDVSSAHLIEASRLAETLAALRGRGVPGLPEMLEASRAVLTFGADTPLQLVTTQLIIGTGLGSIPASVETAPLARDLAASQRRLRLPPETFTKTLELDLRGDTDLARSHLLHRLRVLGVHWGEPTTDQRQAQGTFRELWKLRWDPTFAVALVTQSRWGNTIPEAASARLRDEAGGIDAVVEVAARLEVAILANLPEAVAALVERLAAASAVATDVTALMDALPSLARAVRYGNVRGTDRGTLAEVTEGIVVRAAVGLALAVASLDDDAAAEMVGRIEATEGAVSILERDELRATWSSALEGVANQRAVHGQIAGRVVRILLDRGRFTNDDVALRLSAAISRGATPTDAAAFVEGFLAGPGALLVHDLRLFAIIDDWLSAQSDDAFTSILPLLRRTFARFTPPERRTLGERARSARTARAASPGARALPPVPVPADTSPAAVTGVATEPATSASEPESGTLPALPAPPQPVTEPESAPAPQTATGRVPASASEPASAAAAPEPAAAAPEPAAKPASDGFDLLDDLLGLGDPK